MARRERGGKTREMARPGDGEMRDSVEGGSKTRDGMEGGRW